MKSHLAVEAPSSTTVSYVVASKKRPTSKTLILIGYCLRVSLAFHVLLANLCKLQEDGMLEHGQGYAELLFRLTFIDSFVEYLASRAEWWQLGITSAILL